ncbi:MAG: DUF2232 domain-containing protein [Candidatus Eisenbacteria bacterium]
MTSIADPGFEAVTRRRTGAGLLGILALILLGQLLTPDPWTYLWPVLPVAGAAALLLAQTGVPAAGWLPPLFCAVILALFGVADQPWAWCLLAGVVAAALLGLAERQGRDDSSRLWAYLPLVVLAAAFPLAPGYREFVERVVAAIRGQEVRQIASLRDVAFRPDQRLAFEQFVGAVTDRQVAVVQAVLPTLLFAWLALLVHLAERMAHRLAELVRRPLSPPLPFTSWRLPPGAVWFFIAGLALVAAREAKIEPVGINLAAATGLAFGVQGLAVLKAVLSSQGMAPGMVMMLFVFVWFMLGPVLLLAATGVGLMDLWLDFRHLEPRSDSEPEGGRPWK